jgi:hypothetical protein
MVTLPTFVDDNTLMKLKILIDELICVQTSNKRGIEIIRKEIFGGHDFKHIPQKYEKYVDEYIQIIAKRAIKYHLDNTLLYDMLFINDINVKIIMKITKIHVNYTFKMDKIRKTFDIYNIPKESDPELAARMSDIIRLIEGKLLFIKFNTDVAQFLYDMKQYDCLQTMNITHNNICKCYAFYDIQKITESDGYNFLLESHNLKLLEKNKYKPNESNLEFALKIQNLFGVKQCLKHCKVKKSVIDKYINVVPFKNTLRENQDSAKINQEIVELLLKEYDLNNFSDKDMENILLCDNLQKKILYGFFVIHNKIELTEEIIKNIDNDILYNIIISGNIKDSKIFDRIMTSKFIRFVLKKYSDVLPIYKKANNDININHLIIAFKMSSEKIINYLITEKNMVPNDDCVDAILHCNYQNFAMIHKLFQNFNFTYQHLQRACIYTNKEMIKCILMKNQLNIHNIPFSFISEIFCVTPKNSNDSDSDSDDDDPRPRRRKGYHNDKTSKIYDNIINLFINCGYILTNDDIKLMIENRILLQSNYFINNFIPDDTFYIKMSRKKIKIPLYNEHVATNKLYVWNLLEWTQLYGCYLDKKELNLLTKIINDNKEFFNENILDIASRKYVNCSTLIKLTT